MGREGEREKECPIKTEDRRLRTEDKKMTANKNGNREKDRDRESELDRKIETKAEREWAEKRDPDKSSPFHCFF